MATINKRIKSSEVTYEGAPAAIITPKQQLERSVMSCLLWEDSFYEEGKEIAQRICELVGVCDKKDVADIAIRAKRDMRLRHVPLLLARELTRTKEGRAELAHVIPNVITRTDDITEILAMYLRDRNVTGRAPAKLAWQLKKHLRQTFEKFDEYQLAKYNGGSKAITLKQAMKLLHPIARNKEELALWGRLIKGELSTPDTWEVAISAAKSTEEKKEAWERLIKEGKLGGLATLRNIRNMTKANVDQSVIEDAIKGINAGKLLPINFISSAKYNVQYEPLLEKKFLECFANKEKVKGSTIILVDISGSMDANIAGKSELLRTDVACSLAMIAVEMFEKVRIFSFSDSTIEIPARRGFGLRDAILRSQAHSGTDLGGAVKTAPNCDRLIVITDEQSSSPVPQRKNGYMLNVASYKNGVGYREWTHIDGWSDKVLDYIVKYEAQNTVS